MPDLLVINGPNLNLLGTREPEHYGSDTLENINRRLEQLASARGYGLECVQSNAEVELIEHIHRAGKEGVRFILINPAAFTHTSVALRDALKFTGIPFYTNLMVATAITFSGRHRSYQFFICR